MQAQLIQLPLISNPKSFSVTSWQYLDEGQDIEDVIFDLESKLINLIFDSRVNLKTTAIVGEDEEDNSFNLEFFFEVNNMNQNDLDEIIELLEQYL